MLLLETKLFKAQYFETQERVQILMRQPDVQDTWVLIQELKATFEAEAVFVAKIYILDLVLETVEKVK